MASTLFFLIKHLIITLRKKQSIIKQETLVSKENEDFQKSFEAEVDQMESLMEHKVEVFTFYPNDI
jgi:hypothetical protein